jgi:hypothetical protein
MDTSRSRKLFEFCLFALNHFYTHANESAIQILNKLLISIAMNGAKNGCMELLASLRRFFSAVFVAPYTFSANSVAITSARP